MTKELIQQLKETDPDTYKQYRLEYMKSLFDLKKFQFLFLKNNQSRTWTEDYMKNLLSKRNDLLFDPSEIYHASLSAIYNDEFFKDNYYSLDEFLLKVFPNVKSNHPNMSGMSFVIHEPEFMQLKIQQEKCGEHPSRNFRKIYWKHQNGSCKLIL